MTLTNSDRRLFQILIIFPDVIDWKGISVLNMDANSGQYLDKATQLIPKNSPNHIALRNAVMSTLPNAKCLHYHWLIKTLAAIFEPDSFGNRITPMLILAMHLNRQGKVQ